MKKFIIFVIRILFIIFSLSACKNQDIKFAEEFPDIDILKSAANKEIRIDVLQRINTLKIGDPIFLFVENVSNTPIKLEEDYGGMGIYFNGAQGNINPYMYIKYDSPWDRDDDAQYDAAVDYGYAIAEWANLALEDAKTFKNLPLQLTQISLELPIENEGFIYLMTHGLINREVYLTEEGWKLTTFISGVKMGPIEMVTVPGELFSEISLYVKSYMPKYGFLLGLTPEQLGYIIPQDQWAPNSGEVGESNSMGYQMAPLITQGLLEVVEAFD